MRLRYGHQRQVNRGCPLHAGHPRFTCRGCPSRCPRIFQSICYCYHTGIFCWTPAIYLSLVSVSQSHRNICISLSLAKSTHAIFSDNGGDSIQLSKYQSKLKKMRSGATPLTLLTKMLKSSESYLWGSFCKDNF